MAFEYAKKYIFAVVAFIDEILERLAGVPGKIPDDRQFRMVVDKFLQDFRTRRSRISAIPNMQKRCFFMESVPSVFLIAGFSVLKMALILLRLVLKVINQPVLFPEP